MIWKKIFTKCSFTTLGMEATTYNNPKRTAVLKDFRLQKQTSMEFSLLV